MICKNCDAEVSTKYCGNCGQKASTKRFSTKIVLKELMNKLLPYDKGVIYTTVQLLTAPGSSMRAFLAGKRMDFTKPLSYMLLVCGFSLIFFSSSDMQQGMRDGFGTAKTEAAKEIQMKFSSMFTSNLTLVYSLMIPFMALTSMWFFRKYKLNYAEYLVISAYYSAGSIVAGMPIMMLMKYLGNSSFKNPLFWLLTLVYLGYLVWAYVHFFKDEKRWLTVTKTLLAYLLAYVFYTILIALVMVGILVAMGGM